jgi:putative flippase GtrA
VARKAPVDRKAPVERKSAEAPLKLGAQFARYVVVGGVSFVADAGTLWALTNLAHVHYLVSNVAGFVIGLTLNYLLSIAWVFQKRSGLGLGAEFGAFALIGVLGLGLNEVLLWLGTGLFALPLLLSKCGATGVVLVWNFGARKWLLYRK